MASWRFHTLGALALAFCACTDNALPRPPETAPLATGASSTPAQASASPSGAPTVLADLRPPAPPDPPIVLAAGGSAATKGEAGLATTVDPNATRAAVAVLEKGGNAIDAAVAAAYVLAVTHPSAGNLGGGGFMIVHLANGETHAIDFRETAPAAVTTAKVVAEVEAGAFGYASVAVPGTVAGLDLAREKFGTRPLAELLAPAIALAKKGHALSPRAAMSLDAQWKHLKKDPAARAIFGAGNDPLKAGDRIVQRDLAKTLEAIAQHGDAGFYAGPVADAIETAMNKHRGDITKADLASYRARIRAPLTFAYRGFVVETMPPPSMGGVAVAQTMLELERQGAHQAPLEAGLHLYIEASKRAYADRRSVGADPDFYGDAVPAGALAKLLSQGYLAARTPAMDLAHATPASAISPDAAGAWVKKESPETTHLSVVDSQGNAVSCTVTLSASFGAKIVVPGTGVLFSNALGAFSPAGPNVAAPGKRMASSMTPTIVSRGKRALLVVGSPGGDTIPSTVSLLLMSLIDQRMTVDQAGLRGRLYAQLSPDEIRLEAGREPPVATRRALEALGHKLAPSPIPIGDAKLILIEESTGVAWGFADPREGGLALGALRPGGRPAR